MFIKYNIIQMYSVGSMPKKGLHFAVRDGRNPGIYSTWEECKAQIIGVETAKWKRFHVLQEAEEYLQCGHVLNGEFDGSELRLQI